MTALKFSPGISPEFVRFLQRLLIFYSYNYKQANSDGVKVKTAVAEPEKTNSDKDDATTVTGSPRQERLSGLMSRLRSCKMSLATVGQFDPLMATQA